MSALRSPNSFRGKFHPRQDILDEVVAGLIWMKLDLPGDASRQEIQSFAHGLVSRIGSGGDESAIVAEIAVMQSRQFGRPANLPMIRDLARRAIQAVNGA